MAVALRRGGVGKAVDMIPAMPEIHSKLLSHYRALLPNRVQEFPANEEEILQAPAETFEAGFEHLLRYDAESVFWCMYWWLIQAKPKDSQGNKLNSLDSLDWLNFIGVGDGDVDARYGYVAVRKPFPLHPTYAPISRLLEKMAEHLRIDLKFSKDKIKSDNPEYLCEVFQRLILNFLVEHRQADFLRLPKDEQWRDILDPYRLMARYANTQSITTETEASGHGSSTSHSGPERAAKRPHEDAGESVSEVNIGRLFEWS